MNIYFYIYRKTSKKPAKPKQHAKNGQLSLLACTIFSSQWHRVLMHLNYSKQELHPEKGDYNYAGLILPISQNFYSEKDLSNVDMILCRQIPWSLMGYNQWKKQAGGKTVNNASCLIDSLLYSLNYSIYIESISHTSAGIKPKLFKYWGCRDCILRNDHVMFPWSPFVPLTPCRYLCSSARSTWSSILTLWESLAEENNAIKKLLNYTYFQTLVIGQIIMKRSGNESVQKELTNAYHVPTLKKEVLGSFGIVDIELKCLRQSPDYDFKTCNAKEFDDKKRSDRRARKLADYQVRPLYVQMTKEIGIEFIDKTNEDKFWIQTECD